MTINTSRRAQIHLDADKVVKVASRSEASDEQVGKSAQRA